MFSFPWYPLYQAKESQRRQEYHLSAPLQTGATKHTQQTESWTSRNAPINPETFVEQIKPIVWGWVNYFKHTNASKAFKGLQRFINIRFRRYLTHRRKGHGFG